MQLLYINSATTNSRNLILDMNSNANLRAFKRRYNHISTDGEFLSSYDEYILQNSFPSQILETMNSLERYKLFNFMKNLIKNYKRVANK